MGYDVEEAQEFAVDAPAGGDDARQEGVLESGISGPVAVHLGASGALEDPAGLRVAKGPVSAHVSQMISPNSWLTAEQTPKTGGLKKEATENWCFFEGLMVLVEISSFGVLLL